MKSVLFGLLVFLFTGWDPSVWAAGGEVVETLGDGQVNWSQGTLTAKGSGVPPKEAKNIAQARLLAERAALVDARRNLLEALKGIRVDSESRIENYMVKSDEIRLQAEGFVQGSAELKEQKRYLSDGAIEVTVAVNLKGDFLQFLLTSADVQKTKPPEPSPAAAPEPVKPEKTAEPAESKSVAEPKILAGEKVPAEKLLPPLTELPRYTGLVIDTRGTSMRPALVPKVLDESGRELYQGQYVSPERAAQEGVALYTRDLTSAQTNPRVGKNPLTVKALRVNPSNPSDIFLSEPEALKLAPFARQGTFLEECKVLIVLD